MKKSAEKLKSLQNNGQLDLKIERLKLLVSTLTKGNKSEFARQISVSESAFSQWYGKTAIQYEKILNAYPQVSAEWLIRGHGTPFLPQPEPEAEPPATTDPVPPPSVLQALVHQLAVKDAQIATLMELLKQ